MREYKAMYRAAYDFHQRHIRTQNNPRWWAEAAQDMRRISNLFGNDQFIMALLGAVAAEMERKHAERNGGTAE